MEILPEVEVWYALPALRRELAVQLKELGLAQKEIAKKLGLAPSAVSQYLKGKRGTSKLPENMHKRIKLSAKRIADGAGAKQELMKLTNHLRESRAICEIHHQNADVPKNCSCCFD